MKDFHTQHLLANHSSGTVEFVVRADAGPAQRIPVPAGESLALPTDPVRASWSVHVAVGGRTSPALTTSNLNTTFTVTNAGLSASEPVPPHLDDEAIVARQEAVGKIRELGAAKNLDALLQIAEREIGRRHHDTVDAVVLDALATTLASVDLGDWDRQEAMVQRCALAALSQHERLSVAEEVAFALRLTEPAPTTARKQELSHEQRTGLWLRACRRLRAAIDPAFDPLDRPLLTVAPPVATGLPAGVVPRAIGDEQLREIYEHNIEKNRRKAVHFREQHELRRAEAKLRAALRTHVLTTYARPRLHLHELESLLRAHEPDPEQHAELLEAVNSEIAKFTPVVEASGKTAQLVPRDNFAGRSMAQFGVGEEIDLSIAGLSPLDAEHSGGVAWSIESGVGSILTGDRAGNATFRVGAPACETTLVAKVLSGPHAGAIVGRADLLGAVPTGAFMTQNPGTGLWHRQNSFSVGFKGLINLTPDNVSYAGVTFREGTVAAVASGWLSNWNGLVHAIGAEHTITGAVVDCVDTVSSGQKSPPPDYAAGDFLWAIPWQYSDNGGAWTSFYTANHHATSAADENAMIEKAGAGPFTKNASDPDSNY